MADVIHRIKYNGNVIDIRGPADATEEELRAAVAGYRPAAPKHEPGKIPPRPNLTAGQVLKGAIVNAPGSAVQLAKDVVTPFIHPIETGKNLAALGGGVLSKMGIGDFDQSTANAVGEYLANRYGGVEALKHTLAEDPVGLAADAAGFLTGGGALTAKATGTLGRVGRVASTAGRAVDPISNAARVAKATFATRPGQYVLAPVKATGSLAGTAALYPVSLMSGVPVSDVKRAFTTNPRLGAALERHMAGTADIDEPLSVTKNALNNLRKEGMSQYRSNIKGVTSDPTFLSMKAVRKAVQDAKDAGMYKGVSINDATADVWDRVNAKIEEFAKIPGGQGRTVEGLDKLKQAIYAIGANEPYHSPAKYVANKARRAVIDEINKQAPDYAKVMAPYQKMMETVEDIEQTMSLGDAAAKDTAMRKLLSLSRNGANTNYGRRASQMDLLAKYGAEEVPYMLAGRSLGSVEPRGLQRLGGEGLTIASLFNPVLAPALAATSPRVVGKTARAASKLPALLSKYGAGTPAPLVSAQVGRASKDVENQAYRRLMAEYLYPSKKKKKQSDNPFATLSDEDLRALIEGPPGIEASEPLPAVPAVAADEEPGVAPPGPMADETVE